MRALWHAGGTGPRVPSPQAVGTAPRSDEHRAATTLEIGRALAALAPALSRRAGPRTTLSVETDDLPLQVRIAPADFDTVLHGVVADAGAAGAGSVVLRARRVGQRIWLLVADDGRPTPRRDPTGIAALVRTAHGRLRIHRGPSRGTAMCMILPAVLTLAAGEPRARTGRLTPKQETNNAQDRQSIAA